MVNRSAAPGPVAPVLVYEEVGEAIEWLCEAFGFAERLRYGPEGRPEGAQLAVGEGSVFLVGPRASGRTDHVVFRSPRPGEVTHSVQVRVEDVDRHHEHAVRRGVRVLHPPETYPYGERQYSVEDLGGHRWTFSQSVADVAPQSWGAWQPIPGSPASRHGGHALELQAAGAPGVGLIVGSGTGPGGAGGFRRLPGP